MKLYLLIPSVLLALVVTLASAPTLIAQCSCSSCSTDDAYAGVPDFHPSRSYGDSTVMFAPATYRQGAYESLPGANATMLSATTPMPRGPQSQSQSQRMPSFAPEQYPMQHYQGAPYPGQPYPNQPYPAQPFVAPQNYTDPAMASQECYPCDNVCDPVCESYNACDDRSFCTLGMFGGWNRSTVTDNGDLFETNDSTGEFTDGFVAGLSVGRRFTKCSRMDFEFGYRTDEAQRFPSGPLSGAVFAPTFNGEFEMYTAMANFYLDLPNRTRFTPYVGAGIGYAYLDAEFDYAGLNYEMDDSSALAYQAMAGLSTRVSARCEMYAEYRYLATEDVKLVSANQLAPVFEGPYRAHNIIGGLRFEF